MKEIDFWEKYESFTQQLAEKLPEFAVPLGEFIVTVSPILAIVLAFALLIDKLFERASIKFLAKISIKLCRWMWRESHKEPEHKGLITEAPIWFQRAFHKSCAWFQGCFGLIMLTYSLIVIGALLFLELKEGLVVQGTLVLLSLSLACIFVAFMQFGLCHQSIRLARSVDGN